MKTSLFFLLSLISLSAFSQGGTKYTVTIAGGTTYNVQTFSPIVQAVTSGTSATLTDSTTMFVINPSSAIASYTATLCAAPFNGKVVTFSFGGTISTTGTAVVTSLTILANSGHAIVGNGVVGTVETDDHISLVFYNTKWYRL